MKGYAVVWKVYGEVVRTTSTYSAGCQVFQSHQCTAQGWLYNKANNILNTSMNIVQTWFDP